MGNRCRYRGRTRQPRYGPGRLGDRAVHDALFVPGGHRQAHDRSREFDRISHIFFRTIRPTMRRYVECDSPCMAERSQAGGDALLNLGGHGFDIAWFVTGEKPEVISAVLSQPPHPGEVEDYTLATLRTPSGILFHNEVGYTMPTGPANRTDGEKKVAGEPLLLRGLQLLAPDREEPIPRRTMARRLSERRQGSAGGLWTRRSAADTGERMRACRAPHLRQLPRCRPMLVPVTRRLSASRARG